MSYANNPAIVDEAFVRLVKLFVEAISGEDVLDPVWYWYRFESQERGNIHVHGLARPKSDPGVVKPVSEIAQGRKAQLMLMTLSQQICWRCNRHYSAESPLNIQCPHDLSTLENGPKQNIMTRVRKVNLTYIRDTTKKRGLFNMTY